MRAPQEIVRQFLFARAAERRNHDAERPGGIEHRADRAVLAGGVGALQHDQECALTFRVEPVLHRIDGDRILAEAFARRRLVVTAFRRPSEEELAHDFLWRAHIAAPRRGFIGIFNRSHYEDVLIGRVRKLAPAAEIEARYAQINAFENILVENGTTILKFMLHISRKEQGERLKERLAERKSQWKFNPGDLDDRKLWNAYQHAYEIMLQRCSTAHAPWHVIPADHKWARNAAIARIVRTTLETMNPQYPRPPWNPKSFVIR